MGIFSSGPLSNKALGILPGDMPEMPQMPGLSGLPARGGQSATAGQMSPWKAALGGLLDSISAQTGGQPMVIPHMLQQRQQSRELELAQQKRQQDLEDQIQLAQVKAGMREPTALQQNFSWFQGLTPEQRKQFGHYQDLTRPLIPLDIQSAAGGPVMREYITQSEAMDGGRPPPPQPGQIEDGYRFKGGNAADPNAWEPVGGPSQSATGIFPGR